MPEFRTATPPGVVQAEEFVISTVEADRLRTAQLTTLDEGVLFQPDDRSLWTTPARGSYHGVMTAVDAAGGIHDPEGGLGEVPPSVIIFQERAMVQIPYPNIFRRGLARLTGNRPDTVTAKLKRHRLTYEAVHSMFTVQPEERVVIRPPEEQTVPVDHNVETALLDPGWFVPDHVTVACGVMFGRTVQFDSSRPPLREGRTTTYAGVELHTTGFSNSGLPTGERYDATLMVEHPTFWQGVQSRTHGRSAQSQATLTPGKRWQ